MKKNAVGGPNKTLSRVSHHRQVVSNAKRKRMQNFDDLNFQARETTKVTNQPVVLTEDKTAMKLKKVRFLLKQM